MSLKLGTQTASMTNHIYSRSTIGQPEPVEGMGATILCWTDRDAGTITKVWRSAKDGPLYLIVREDTATRTDKNGMSESQEYNYAPDENGRQHYFRQRKDGSWQGVKFNGKRYVKEEGNGLLIGQRRHYHDFSF